MSIPTTIDPHGAARLPTGRWLTTGLPLAVVIAGLGHAAEPQFPWILVGASVHALIVAAVVLPWPGTATRARPPSPSR